MKHVFHKKWIADVIDYPDSELQDLKDDSWSLKKFVYWIIVKLLKKTLPSADLVFALGPNKEVGLPSELINGYGLSEEKVHPVLEGTDLSRTKPVGLKNDHSIFKVCYVGSLKRIRGIDHLIEATEIAREQLPNIKTYLLGDIRYSEDKQALLDMVKRYNIEEHIFLSEARVPHQDVLDHIETSDVCLLLLDPSKTNYHYSYPIKLFEYLAMGKAVVSTNFPGIEEVVHSEHNGLLVPFGNSESLAKAIVRIAQDIKLKKTLEQNARPSIIDFDWAILNQKILDVIHSRFIRKDFE
jgi:glycosyltransferase involved in cell wall biosynthesis